MAKVKIQAGAEFDVITKQEMREALTEVRRSWMQEVSHGVGFPRFTANGLIVGAALDFGANGPAAEFLGPAPGFLWDVRRLRITGLTTGDVVSIYLNDANPSSLIATTGDLAGGRLFTWAEQVILYPGDALRVVGSGLTATGTITAAGQVRELPVSLAWRLGG